MTAFLGGDGFFTEIDATHPDTLYAEVYNGDHYRSLDNGVHTYIKMSGITEGGPWSTPTFMDYTNSAILWTAHNTKIYRSTDRMEHWTFMNNPLGYGGGRNIDQSRTNPNMLAVLGASKLWITTDNGTTWVGAGAGLPSTNMSDVAVGPTDPNIILVTVQTYSASPHQIFKSTDMGATWNAIDATIPDEPINSVAIDPQNPNFYFIGTDNGVMVSFDAGANWEPFNTGLPHVVVSDLRIQNSGRLLRAGTHGRGLWEVDISNIGPTAVNNPKQHVQPVSLRVFGSPAHDSAILHYALRSAGQTKLALFDAQGRQVRMLMDKFHQGYADNLTVDTKSLPSGVYFAKLSCEGALATAKLVVEH